MQLLRDFLTDKYYNKYNINIPIIPTVTHIKFLINLLFEISSSKYLGRYNVNRIPNINTKIGWTPATAQTNARGANNVA
jgi:hypothetical protein